MSARKASHGTIFLIVSSGSPLALIASSRRSTSKKPFCPMTRSLHPPATAGGQRVRFATTWRDEFFEVPSRWAINPFTFKYGYICFNGNQVLDERLVPISLPKPVLTELPDTGFPWQEEWAVNMKCISGADAGVEVVFKATTDGALKAVVLIVDQVRDRVNGGQHDGKIVPIVLLEKDSYPHQKHGKVWIP